MMKTPPVHYDDYDDDYLSGKTVSTINEQHDEIDILKDEIDILKDKIDILKTALIQIDALDPESRLDMCSEYAKNGLILTMGEIARTALDTINK